MIVRDVDTSLDKMSVSIINWYQWCNNGLELQSSEFEPRQEHCSSFFPFFCPFFTHFFSSRKFEMFLEGQRLSYTTLIKFFNKTNIGIQIIQLCLSWSVINR